MSAALPAALASAAAAADFVHWWRLPGEWVEPVNERRGGWSGMLRARDAGRIVYVKRQCNHLCRSLRHPLGWPTSAREWQFLTRLHALGLGAPVPLFHGVRRREGVLDAVLVTEELNGYAPLSAQPMLAAGERRRLALRVGSVLGTLHRARLQHGCLYDKHVMVRWREGEPDVALLDLEKMRVRLTARTAARHDLEQLARHQSLWSPADWRALLAAHDLALSAALP